MILLGTGIQRASKASRVGVGAEFLAFASYDVTMSGEDLPTVNFQSYDAGDDVTYDEGIIGVVSAEANFGGDWDAGVSPLGEPPGLYPRDDLADLSLVLNRSDTTEWGFPLFRVRSAKNGSALGGGGGKVTFTAGGKNQGPFTWPTESV